MIKGLLREEVPTSSRSLLPNRLSLLGSKIVLLNNKLVLIIESVFIKDFSLG